MRFNLLFSLALLSQITSFAQANAIKRQVGTEDFSISADGTVDRADDSFGGVTSSIPTESAVVKDTAVNSATTTAASATKTASGESAIQTSADADEEAAKTKEEEGKSARCSSEHYQIVDGEKPFIPFCNPVDGQHWRADQVGYYQVTWDPKYFTSNATVEISLIYEDPPEGGPNTIAYSPLMSSNIGIWEVKPSEDALTFGGEKHENATLRVMITSSDPGKTQIKGPRVLLKPKEDPKPKYEEPPVNTTAVAIAIPVIFVVAVGFALLLHFTLRRERRIGPIHIGGRRGRRHGYGHRQNRMERMKSTKGAIRLDDETTAGQSPDWELANVQGGRNEPMSPFSESTSGTPASPDRSFNREKRIF